MRLKTEKSNNLCNDCPSDIRGFCCRVKNIKRIDKYTYIIRYGDACPHLNKAGRCKIYNKRHEVMGDKCLTIEKALLVPFTLPFGCAYLGEKFSKI